MKTNETAEYKSDFSDFYGYWAAKTDHFILYNIQKLLFLGFVEFSFSSNFFVLCYATLHVRVCFVLKIKPRHNVYCIPVTHCLLIHAVKLKVVYPTCGGMNYDGKVNEG